ncbi:two-component system response regulator [Pseudohaliea sp.]|uniref:HD-GYP domain-containing protein n=1 Tax=Pseudohaliea sp. TaxID=2740289 RepID=UPI0032EDE908
MARERTTVLVVDDTPQNIDLLAGLLRPHYQVKVANRGRRALEIVRSPAQPDLILLDIMMPEMDGYAVCRALKADYTTRHIPVIFTTAKNSTEDELLGLEVGAVDYVTKPISPPILLARVRTHLALCNQRRALEEQVRERTAQLQQTRLEIVQRLGRAAEYKDNETGLHVIRMSHYARLLGERAGMGAQEVDLLLHAAPMHDIGKIGIPDQILQKPGRLTPEEWEVMKTHCQIGSDILGQTDGSELLAMARVIALNHHERWDGSGYPHGLAGEDIPRVARMVAIADVFDALTSDRPYKEAWPLERALALLRDQAGSHFDPLLVQHFLDALPEVEEIQRRYAEGSARAERH